MNYTAMIDSDVNVANLAGRFVVQPIEMHACVGTCIDYA